MNGCPFIPQIFISIHEILIRFINHKKSLRDTEGFYHYLRNGRQGFNIPTPPGMVNPRGLTRFNLYLAGLVCSSRSLGQCDGEHTISKHRLDFISLDFTDQGNYPLERTI